MPLNYILLEPVVSKHTLIIFFKSICVYLIRKVYF
nr:MAG TPA: hypothetical protein [Caudoviricetes sp.]